MEKNKEEQVLKTAGSDMKKSESLKGHSHEDFADFWSELC